MDLSTREIIRGMLPERKSGSEPYPAQAEVVAVVGGTAYVRLPGASWSSPVDATSVAMAKGDIVKVRVSHEGIEAQANMTSPAVGIKHVDQVVEHKVSETFGKMSADFAKIGDLQAAHAAIGKLEAEIGSIGDLDVGNLSAVTADIESLKVSKIKVDSLLTATLNSLYGHWEDAYTILTDERGNPVLDEDGNVIPIYRPTWVSDSATIAEAIKKHLGRYTSIEEAERSLSNVQDALNDAIEQIKAGLDVETDGDGKVTVTIGAPDERSGFAVTDDGMAFVMKDGDGNVIHKASMNAEAFQIENAEVSSYLKLGLFSFRPRLNGGLTFQWIGG